MTSLHKRVAREARRLAYECASGTAPEIDGDVVFESLPLGHSPPRRGAIGEVPRRAAPDRHPFKTWLRLRTDPHDADLLVMDASEYAADHADRQSRLVFPLLALADAAEAVKAGR